MPAGPWARGKCLCNPTESLRCRRLLGCATDGLMQCNKTRTLVTLLTWMGTWAKTDLWVGGCASPAG
jgi:hypothetical protein